MRIKFPKMKIANIAQAIDGENQRWGVGMEIPMKLKRNPVSKDWDLASVTMEITSDREVIFWNDGERYEGEFLFKESSGGAFNAHGQVAETDTSVIFKVDAQAKVIDSCLSSFCEYAQAKANMAATINKHKNMMGW